jgi:hypothetical protein
MREGHSSRLGPSCMRPPVDPWWKLFSELGIEAGGGGSVVRAAHGWDIVLLGFGDARREWPRNGRLLCLMRLPPAV